MTEDRNKIQEENEELSNELYAYYERRLTPKERDELDRDKKECKSALRRIMNETGRESEAELITIMEFRDLIPESVNREFFFVGAALELLEAKKYPGTEGLPLSLLEHHPFWQRFPGLSREQILEMCWRQSQLLRLEQKKPVFSES